jgi:uncharacterized membrane protein
MNTPDLVASRTQDVNSTARIELQAPTQSFRIHQVLLVLATVGMFGPALIAWSSIVQVPVVGAMATVACVLILIFVVLTVTSKTELALHRLDYAVLILALALLGAWAVTELYFYPAYGTDEAAFVQYAAQLLLHGHNPYTHNLLPALTQYRVPIQFATYKLNGTIVSNLGYPSLSFLLVVPFIALTHGVQAIIIENVLFLAIEVVLLFFFFPKMYRALGVVVVLGLPFLFDYSIGGDIVTMSIPFMLILAFHWTDIGRGGRLGRGGVLRAICLGVAASISQFAWFVAPFVILGIWCFRRAELGRRRATSVLLGFISVTVVTFLLLNAPFVVWSPRAWLTGVLSPLDQHAIPFGQGLIDVTVFFRLGGGNLAYYTYSAVLIFATLLIFYGAYCHRIWRAAFILPSVVFLFSTRSLSEYFIMMAAMWLVSTFSPGGGWQSDEESMPLSQSAHAADPRRWSTNSPRRKASRTVALFVPVVAAVMCLVLAMTSSPPLRISLRSVESNGQFRSIWKIEAEVSNQSNSKVKPHFATDASGYMTTFWNATSGPRTLGPGQSALYTLVAPNVGSMPGVTQPFVLQAVTATPQSISSSPLFTPEPFDCTISPSYINRLVPFGQRVTLTVVLRSPYGAPVDRKGVRIALGQVIYAQSALIPGEARINGAPEGQSPVFITTNHKGVATFRIQDSSNQGGNPIYFQAYVAPNNSFPYGYSEVVSVQWASAASPRK